MEEQSREQQDVDVESDDLEVGEDEADNVMGGKKSDPDAGLQRA
jgi:hypothetical protein